MFISVLFDLSRFHKIMNLFLNIFFLLVSFELFLTDSSLTNCSFFREISHLLLQAGVTNFLIFCQFYFYFFVTRLTRGWYLPPWNFLGTLIFVPTTFFTNFLPLFSLHYSGCMLYLKHNHWAAMSRNLDSLTSLTEFDPPSPEPKEPSVSSMFFKFFSFSKGKLGFSSAIKVNNKI